MCSRGCDSQKGRVTPDALLRTAVLVSQLSLAASAHLHPVLTPLLAVPLQHGPIYVSETAFAPGKQPNVATLGRGMQFHRLEVYGRDLLRHVRNCSQAEHDGQGEQALSSHGACA